MDAKLIVGEMVWTEHGPSHYLGATGDGGYLVQICQDGQRISVECRATPQVPKYRLGTQWQDASGHVHELEAVFCLLENGRLRLYYLTSENSVQPEEGISKWQQLPSEITL